ncbi:MAG: tRNA (adenosine(37)-N6)-threonylcarbamoyltransferase complex dimerization subunit type 1 TsaB [Oscillospiraceae bacterium]|nr:tRNA (adenosine(37)-N6)-threonylcarbamoyltransferase complex dimerization subunit type 1 TsaB [Oscillospiraceae bacterium]
MLLLAFETSAKAGSVALYRDGCLLAEAYENTGLTHSQTLMTMAEAMLKNSGFTPQQVEAVAVAAGPGSFTGVRIGVAAAKGFAWGGELPCYGVSTLEAMALGFGTWEGTVVCVMDARRNQVYNALFSARDGHLTRLCEDRAISLEELAEALEKIPGPLYLVGDGSRVCYNALSRQLARLVMPPEHRMHQRAAGVALAAAKKIAAGENGDGAALEPNYLRLSQAERERLEKEKK